MFASIKENCVNDITMVLGGIFGLALFSGMAQAVTCTPTGAAAAEAEVSFSVALNICDVSTTIGSPTSVEGLPLLIFMSRPSNGSGNTPVEGERDYSARVDQGTLDIFELNDISIPSNTITLTSTGILPAVLVGTFPSFGTFRMDLLLVVVGPDITVNSATVSAVPIPATLWLFGSGLLGLIGIARSKQA